MELLRRSEKIHTAKQHTGTTNSRNEEQQEHVVAERVVRAHHSPRKNSRKNKWTSFLVPKAEYLCLPEQTKQECKFSGKTWKEVPKRNTVHGQNDHSPNHPPGSANDRKKTKKSGLAWWRTARSYMCARTRKKSSIAHGAKTWKKGRRRCVLPPRAPLSLWALCLPHHPRSFSLFSALLFRLCTLLFCFLCCSLLSSVFSSLRLLCVLFSPLLLSSSLLFSSS